MKKLLLVFLFFINVNFAWALTPIQELILFSGPPQCVVNAYGKWSPLPDLVANDDTGCYWVKGRGVVAQSTLFTNSRTGTRWGANAAGVLVSAPAGQTLIIPDGTGAYEFESRTNKCTNYNANPTDLTNITLSGNAAATLTVVDDTAALLAAGLQNIASGGKVFLLDNSSGLVTAAVATFGGTTGNTNKHTLAIYARNASGTATFGLASGAGVTNVTGTTAYGARLVSANVTPGSSAEAMVVTAPAGAAVYFILNELQEVAFAIRSPIVVAGASATVSDDIRAGTALFNSIALQAQTAFVKTYGMTSGNPPGSTRILSFNNVQALQHHSTTDLQISNGVSSVTGTFGSGDWTGTTKGLFTFNSTTLTALANAGSVGTTAASWGTPAAPVILGNRTQGGRALNGQQQQLALWLTQPALTGITVP